MENQRPNRPRRLTKKQRLKRRLYFLGFFIICLMISFSCGKKVGRAKRLSADAGIDSGYSEGTKKDKKGKSDRKGKNVKKASPVDDPVIADADEAVFSPLQDDRLILVNKDHPLPDDYRVKLVTLNGGVHQGARIAYDSLSRMLTAGTKEGLTFEICSAYRSVERQRELFEEDLDALIARGYSYDAAYEEVAKETMPPGCSEHSTGLAFDIVSFDYQQLNRKQETTKENIWLRKHCAEYGFILRYPEGKEDITGISYESWHFRYVGKEAAEEIMEKGITLEEYLE